MEMYFGDITINGEHQDLSSDPHWDVKGNRDLVIDTAEYGAQDFGYSPDTRFAGGAKAGELGGRLQSVDAWEKDFQGYYGDRVGPLTMQDKLLASGKFATSEFSVDSTFALGWFNSAEQGWPIKNFVGVYFDSASDMDRIVEGLYGTSDGAHQRSKRRVTFRPDGKSYDWTLQYDPTAGGGRGAITFTMNGQKLQHVLAEVDRQKGATLDRFGVFNLAWANSKHCVVYLDDLTYTAEAQK
jgi:hypothetical protein